MIRSISSLLAALCVVFAVAGCAGVGGGAADSDRLVNAIVANDAYTVKGAVQSGGVSPDAKLSVDGYPDGAPMMAIAARAAAIDVLRFLISAGADINARTPVNETPLMLASFFFEETATGRSFERHERAVHLLVESGANLENHPYQYTPLAYAAYQGNERVVRYLIEKGAKVNADAAAGGTYINTPLMMAAIQGHERIARLLLAAGADADVRVYGGHTAAEFAVKYQHHGLAQLLQCAQRQYGAQPAGVNCRAVMGFDALRPIATAAAE